MGFGDGWDFVGGVFGLVYKTPCVSRRLTRPPFADQKGEVRHCYSADRGINCKGRFVPRPPWRSEKEGLYVRWYDPPAKVAALLRVPLLCSKRGRLGGGFFAALV